MMSETVLIKVDPIAPDPQTVARAAALIQDGGVVAFPTETVYGLGADAMSESAVQKIFEAKGRPADNPLIVHIADREMLSRVVTSVGEKTERLIHSFWPGPLTMVLQRKAEVPASVSAGLSTVAVRMPDHRLAIDLIKRANTPIAAPSANSSGRPSPTTAAHVLSDLRGQIDMVLDGGPTRIGIESTVVDMTSELPVILRPGWLTREMLEQVIGPLASGPTPGDLGRSPGTRHKHYAPSARVVLIEHGSPEFIRQTCLHHLLNHRVGFIGYNPISLPDDRFRKVILRDASEDYARSIYSALRELDDKGVEVIVVQGVQDEGGGAAIMDRLRRAATEVLRGD